MRVHVPTLITISLLILVISNFPSTSFIPSVDAFNPSTDILWEYGAEGGSIGAYIPDSPSGSDVFDYGFNPSLPHAKATFIGSPARTGTKAVKMYVAGGAKTGNQYRLDLRKGTVNAPSGGFSGWDQTDMYLSWWIYIPDDNNIHRTDSSMSNVYTDLGGFQCFWRDQPHTTTWRTNWRFKLSKPLTAQKRYLLIHYMSHWDDSSGVDYWANGDGAKPLYYVSSTNTSLCNQWIHLEVFVKWSSSGDGYHTAWIDDHLLGNHTGLRNDPRGFSQWNAYNCEFAYPASGQPFLLFQLYTYYLAPEQFYYWDDAVASTTYVDDYGVGESQSWEKYEDGFESDNLLNWNGTGYSGSSSLTEDFMRGSYDDWSSSVTDGSFISLDTTNDVSGGYAFQVELEDEFNDYGYIKQSLTGAKEYYAGTFFKINATPASGERLTISPYLRDVNTNDKYSGNAMLRNESGTLQIGVRFDNTSGTQYAWANQDFSANIWYWIELRVLHGAGTGVVELWFTNSSGTFKIISETGLSNDYLIDYVYAISANLNMLTYATKTWYDFVKVHTSYMGQPIEYITTTTAKHNEGSHACNMTVDGSTGSFARTYYVTSSISQIFMRSYVNFDELPDSNDTFLNFMRVGESDGTYIASTVVYNMSGSYYWGISVSGGSFLENYTQATINTDKFYCVETYWNISANGNITVWINDNLMCEYNADLSAFNAIGRVYPYLQVQGDQSSAKTLFHDDVVIDDERIYMGDTLIFSVTFTVVSEFEYSPLEGININGSLTDSNGQLKWTNLTLRAIYVFAVKKPDSYYPAWCLGVSESFSWNTTHYILSHNITGSQAGNLGIYFQTNPDPYIYSATDMLSHIASGYFDTPSQANMELVVSADSGATSSTVIHTQGNGKPWTVDGATWSYNPETDLLDLSAVHTSERVVSVDWQEIIVTPQNQTAGFTGDKIAVEFEQDLLPLVGLVAVVSALGLITGTAIYKNAVSKSQRRIRGLKPRQPKKRKPYRPRDF